MKKTDIGQTVIVDGKTTGDIILNEIPNPFGWNIVLLKVTDNGGNPNVWLGKNRKDRIPFVINNFDFEPEQEYTLATDDSVELV